MRLAPSLPPPDMHSGIAPRLLAATLGTYLLCFALMAALQALLPASMQHVLTVIPFLICIATIFWAFSARDVWRAWTMMLIPAALSAAIVLLLPV
jgi:hypothetical protein